MRRLILALLFLVGGCGETPDSSESPPRIVFNSDGTGLTLSEFTPVLSPEQLCRVINELEETPVDVFAWCPDLAGDVVTYPSKVAQVGYGERVSDQEWDRFHPRMRRQGENVSGFIAAGNDPIEILSQRTRQLGRQFWVSLRMNDQHEDDQRRFGIKVSAFKRDHPELLIGTDFPLGRGAYAERFGRTYGWNYSREQVRERKLAVIEELLSRYAVDGIDLDFQRGPWYFKKQEEKLGGPIMTEFVRQVRRKIDEIAASQGRSLTLSARVPPNFAQAEGIGLAVRDWIRQGLVDLITPMDSGYLDMNADVEAFVDEAGSTGARVGAGLEVSTMGYGHATLPMLRAAASGYYWEGAQTLYLFNFDCHRSQRLREHPEGRRFGEYTAEEIQALQELGYPPRIAKMDKHHFVTRDMAGLGPAEGGSKQLPRKLPEDGSVALFRFTVGDDLGPEHREKTPYSTLLRVTIQGSDESSALARFRLNGSVLSASQVRTARLRSVPRRDPSRDRPVCILDFRDPPLKQGSNELALSLHKAGAEPLRVEKIEALIDYLNDLALKLGRAGESTQR